MPRISPSTMNKVLDADHAERDAMFDDDDMGPFFNDPWHGLRGTWSGGPSTLYHDNFTHDMALRIQGEFANDDERLSVAQWVMQRLNEGAMVVEQPPAWWARGMWSVEGKSVKHSLVERHLALTVSGDFGSQTRWTYVLDGMARLLNGGTLPTRTTNAPTA